MDPVRGACDRMPDTFDATTSSPSAERSTTTSGTTDSNSTGAESGESDSDDPATLDDAGGESTVVGDPIDVDVRSGANVIVVGYDAWTEPVIAELLEREVAPTVVTTDEAVGERLRGRNLDVVATADIDEACFRAANVADADAVLVATLDDQLNVLAVLTVMNVDDDAHVVTFAGEAQDVPKLRAAGADRVVSLGQAVGELLVEVALSERPVAEVVRELLGDRR